MRSLLGDRVNRDDTTRRRYMSILLTSANSLEIRKVPQNHKQRSKTRNGPSRARYAARSPTTRERTNSANSVSLRRMQRAAVPSRRAYGTSSRFPC